MAERLSTYFRELHAVNVGILPRVDVDDSMVDNDRRQLVADRVLDAIERERSPEHPDDVLIALTVRDMYMLDRPDWNWVFSLRDGSSLLAVVSIARMDPSNYGEQPDEDLLTLRAAKMVAKNIGVLRFGLATSRDPSSVLYDGLTSLDALDRVDDHFVLH